LEGIGEMTDQVPEPLFSFENGIILVLYKVATAQQKLTKALAVGLEESKIVQAILDLDSASRQLRSYYEQYASQLPHKRPDLSSTSTGRFGRGEGK
jgi:hypothetical protein